MKITSILTAFAACCVVPTLQLAAAEDAESLAKELSNPIASLTSVPFQNNFDWGGDNNAFRYTLNFQPVMPISISEDTNLILRTIVPFISQSDVVPLKSQ